MIESPHHSLSVRPMREGDLTSVLMWRNLPEVRRYMYTSHEITMDEHSRWFAAASVDPRKHLLIFEMDGQASGYVNFAEVAPGGIVDWGFYLAPTAPRGSGRKLGQTALDHAFTKLSFHKVCGKALADNAASIRMHHALGFVQEGILRHQHHDRTLYHDVICFGLISPLWPTYTKR